MYAKPLGNTYEAGETRIGVRLVRFAVGVRCNVFDLGDTLDWEERSESSEVKTTETRNIGTG